MVENDNRLKIIGDNNYINIWRNVGTVTIIGNECSIDVLENYGSVEMIGDWDTVKINVCNSEKSDDDWMWRDIPDKTIVLKKNPKNKPKKSFKALLEKFTSLCVKKIICHKK